MKQNFPNKDSKAFVTTNVYFKKIDPNNPETPYGMKCQLVNKSAGVTSVMVLLRSDKFHTHYAPLAKFDPNEID